LAAGSVSFSRESGSVLLSGFSFLKGFLKENPMVNPPS